MKNIHFILNTLSSSSSLLENEARNRFDSKKFNLIFKKSEYQGHTMKLASASLREGADIIVACGGDGTVNEVAQCLVNSNVALGIVPIGSGNGLARHLQIPVKITSSLDIIKRVESKKIDVGKVNDYYFFCNASVAFSAQVIHCYHDMGNRGLKTYFKAFLKAISVFKYSSFQITEGEESFNSMPLILLFSNTDQLGYNKTLTPDASLFDGKLDMVRVEKSNIPTIAFYMLFALFGKFPSFGRLHRKQFEEIRLNSSHELVKMQIDGEKVILNEQLLHITLIPNSLKVIF